MADPVSWFLIEPGRQLVGVVGVYVATVAEVRGDETEDIFGGVVVGKRYVLSPLVCPDHGLPHRADGSCGD